MQPEPPTGLDLGEEGREGLQKNHPWEGIKTLSWQILSLTSREKSTCLLPAWVWSSWEFRPGEITQGVHSSSQEHIFKCNDDLRDRASPSH